jgi:predicted nucleic acid-binding Zn ribbon protein
MSKDFVRVGEVLNGLGVRLGIGRSADVGIIWKRWDQIVGATLAGHAEPSSLRDGLLRIRAESPAWAAELGYLAGEIRTRANELVGRKAVTDVRVWTGPGDVVRATPNVAQDHGERGRGDSSPADPMEAFERARTAWRRRRS